MLSSKCLRFFVCQNHRMISRGVTTSAVTPRQHTLSLEFSHLWLLKVWPGPSEAGGQWQKATWQTIPNSQSTSSKREPHISQKAHLTTGTHMASPRLFALKDTVATLESNTVKAGFFEPCSYSNSSLLTAGLWACSDIFNFNLKFFKF